MSVFKLRVWRLGFARSGNIVAFGWRRLFWRVWWLVNTSDVVFTGGYVHKHAWDFEQGTHPVYFEGKRIDGMTVLVKQCLVDKPTRGPNGWDLRGVTPDADCRESLGRPCLVMSWDILRDKGIFAVGWIDDQNLDQHIVYAHEDDIEFLDLDDE